MSVSVINHEVRRSHNTFGTNDSYKTHELAKVENAEIPRELIAFKAPYPIKPEVNLLWEYARRREDFMDRDLSPTGVLIALQAEFETSLNSLDFINLHGWAREDYERKRGIKPGPTRSESINDDFEEDYFEVIA